MNLKKKEPKLVDNGSWCSKARHGRIWQQKIHKNMAENKFVAILSIFLTVLKRFWLCSFFNIGIFYLILKEDWCVLEVYLDNPWVISCWKIFSKIFFSMFWNSQVSLFFLSYFFSSLFLVFFYVLKFTSFSLFPLLFLLFFIPQAHINLP